MAFVVAIAGIIFPAMAKEKKRNILAHNYAKYTQIYTMYEVRKSRKLQNVKTTKTHIQLYGKTCLSPKSERGKGQTHRDQSHSCISYKHS